MQWFIDREVQRLMHGRTFGVSPGKRPRVFRDNADIACVYFVEDATGAVKIGYSASIKNRLASLRTGSANALRVLLLLRGGRELEAELHRKFARQRLSGEWFRKDENLRDFIENPIGYQRLTQVLT